VKHAPRFLPCVLALLLALLLSAPQGQAAVDLEVARTFRTATDPLDIAVTMDGKWTFVLGRGGKLYIFAENGSLQETVDVDPAMDRIAASGLEAANIPEKIHLAGSKSRTIQSLDLSFSVAIDTKGAPFLGPENAPVTLVVFSDFECSHCSRVGSLFDEILAKYPKQVKIAFKNSPLAFHQQAQPAALAALAAHRQGRFWQFHDLLFENQKNLSEAKFVEIATRLNLNLEKFNNDRKSPATRQELDRDINEAHKAGVRGTPTLFINGRLLRERNMTQVQQMVDQELAKQNRARRAPR